MKKNDIESRKIARQKILKYLYYKHNEDMNFIASLQLLKKHTGLDSSEIKRELISLRKACFIHLTRISLEEVTETQLICCIALDGIIQIESELPWNEKHEDDNTKSEENRPNLQDMHFRYAVDPTDAVHIKILTFFYNVFLEFPDYMISLWDLSRGPELDSSQLQEIQLAITFLNDEELIKLQDGSFLEYRRHQRIRRPLGKITYKGRQKVNSLFKDNKQFKNRELRSVRLSTPSETTWEDITILISKDSLHIKIKGLNSSRYTFAELGFKDGRKGDLPDSNWEFLRDELAECNGIYTDWPPYQTSKIQKRIQIINKRLKQILHMEERPIIYSNNLFKYCGKKKAGYLIKFHLDRMSR